MASIAFRRFSMDEAEEIVAEIWRCLEQYDIPSPEMSSQLSAPEIVNLSFHFREKAWADIVARQLSGWCTLPVAQRTRAVISSRARRCLPFASGRTLLFPRLR